VLPLGKHTPCFMKKGFTLIELLVVIAVIGMLASIVLVSLKGIRGKASMAQKQSFASQVNHVLGAYAVGIWPLDEGSGTSAKDASGYGNNGTVAGATWQTQDSCALGTCILFNGSDGITIPNSSSLQVIGNQTISLWLYPTTLNARRNPYAKAYGGEGTITQEINGSLSYYYGTCGGNCSPYQGFSSGGNTVELNTWNHFVLVRDLQNMKLRWYKNGKLMNQSNASYAAAKASSLPVYIARGYVSPYVGRIDDVRVFTEALSISVVERLYAEGATRHQMASVPGNR
jgi:prepilin-type N-terminal cleavage/methylation domain-containing protein